MTTSDTEPSPSGVTRLWLTEITHSRIVDRAGEPLGRVEDVIVRLGAGGYPPVTGLIGRLAGRQLFVPPERVGEGARGRGQLSGEALSLLRFERRQGEVLLRRDVLGRRVISVDTGRLITAADIQLSAGRGGWKGAGVDSSPRGGLRRLLPPPLNTLRHEGRYF